MIRNIFLDRDGVINEVIFRNSKVESPRKFSEFNIRQEFIDFYPEIYNLGLSLFVISNQPDIARNKMNIKDLERMTELLRSSFDFNEISYCLHDDNDNCLCRKPKPGLITDLLIRHNLQREDSLIIGDSRKDVGAGINAGINKTVLLQTDYNRDINIQSNYKVNYLHELLKIIRE